MPGPSRSAKRGGPSERRDGAHRQRRTSRPASKRLARRVSWSRRIGLALALVLLVGGAVAFASQALDDGSNGPPAATAPPPPALALLAPTESVTRRARTALVALRPQGLRVDQSYTVRIYVNGAEVRERDLPETERFELSDIPLAQGTNVIGATLVGDGGEGPRSADVTIIRDDQLPDIEISQPAARSTVYTDTVLLRGETEPGASLSVTRSGSDNELETDVSASGRFSAVLELRPGSNSFTLRSVDQAGNHSSTRLTVDRDESAANLTLSVSPEEIHAGMLPATVTMSATVRDELGRLVDGAEVTFGVSPPNASTATYRATTSDGRAEWDELTLQPGDSRGTWLVTVSATLPSGVELRQNGTFTLK